MGIFQSHFKKDAALKLNSKPHLYTPAYIHIKNNPRHGKHWAVVASPTLVYMHFFFYFGAHSWSGKGALGALLCHGREEFLQLLSNPVSCIVHRSFSPERTTSKALYSLCSALDWNVESLFQQRQWRFKDQRAF